MTAASVAYDAFVILDNSQYHNQACAVPDYPNVKHAGTDDWIKLKKKDWSAGDTIEYHVTSIFRLRLGKVVSNSDKPLFIYKGLNLGNHSVS